MASSIGYFETNLRYHFIYLNQSIFACDPFLSYVNINYNTDSHLLSVYYAPGTIYILLLILIIMLQIKEVTEAQRI